MSAAFHRSTLPAEGSQAIHRMAKADSVVARGFGGPARRPCCLASVRLRSNCHHLGLPLGRAPIQARGWECELLEHMKYRMLRLSNGF